MKVIGLFSGIGGFELGLQRAGFEIAAMCEINPFCRRVLAKHWPGVPIYEDVRELTGERLAADGIAVDVICGGFPCQDVSIAGNRLGLDAERSGLWTQMFRLVGDLRPEFVIVENTTGLLNCGLGDVLGDLATLGYDAIWHGIPASAVGAAHQRDRVWIVAYDSRQRRSVCEDDHRKHAQKVISNINRQLAVSLASIREQQSYADPLACVGARIPDGGKARTTYVGSALCRKPDGVSGQLDALGALGNAVAPQIPELIGKAILESQRALSPTEGE